LSFGGSLAIDTRIQQIVRNALTQALALPRPRPVLYRLQRTGSVFSFWLDTVSGENYVVEYKDSLSAPGWNVLQTVPGTGIEAQVTDSASSDSRFYRVYVQ
jgi:hypothetical protein